MSSGAFNNKCVKGILNSLLRCYSEPFLLIMSRQKFPERIAFIQERFEDVFVLDQTKTFHYRGGKTGDSLIMCLVATPRKEWVHENNLPPLPKESFSVHQYTKANTTTDDDTHAYFIGLRDRCDEDLSMPRSRKKKTMMTYDDLGTPTTK